MYYTILLSPTISDYAMLCYAMLCNTILYDYILCYVIFPPKGGVKVMMVCGYS